MQLMPGTARGVAGTLGLPYSPSDLTGSPQYNLSLGSAYIANMLDRFAGSYILALAAYNAGPNRVNQWLSTNGDPRRHRGGDRLDRTDPFFGNTQLRAALPGKSAGLPRPHRQHAARADAGMPTWCDEAPRPRAFPRGVSACVFDAYGTLFDVSAATRALPRRARRSRRRAGGAVAVEAARILVAAQPARRLRRFLACHRPEHSTTLWPPSGWRDPALRSRLMELYFVLDAYPEVRGALGALKSGRPQDGHSVERLSQHADARPCTARVWRICSGEIISVDAAGIYKPHPSGLPTGRRSPRSCRPSRSASSRPTTGTPRAPPCSASASIWINRAGAMPDALPGEPEHEITRSLALPALLGRRATAAGADPPRCSSRRSWSSRGDHSTAAASEGCASPRRSPARAV